MINKTGTIKKKYGGQEIVFSNEHYCAKYLDFSKAGSMFSMHLHQFKHESWVVISGMFRVEWIDTKTAKIHSKLLRKGDKWVNPPMLPHRLICLKDCSRILEISTADEEDDNIRVMPGDNQT
jgi:mannose-6-phosphate isomerase-like protein (cupin superfamily)